MGDLLAVGTRLVYAIQPLEEVRKMYFCDAWLIITDAQRRPLFSLSMLLSQIDIYMRAAAGAIFQCVLNNVGEQLHQVGAIAQTGEFWQWRNVDRNTRALCQGGQALYSVHHHLA